MGNFASWHTEFRHLQPKPKGNYRIVTCENLSLPRANSNTDLQRLFIPTMSRQQHRFSKLRRVKCMTNPPTFNLHIPKLLIDTSLFLLLQVIQSIVVQMTLIKDRPCTSLKKILCFDTQLCSCIIATIICNIKYKKD
jgi:hypothetical protein